MIPDWTPALDARLGTTTNVTPATRCVIEPARFAAAPRSNDPDLAGGHLLLGDGQRYEVVQVDPDGGALKALTFAANLARWSHSGPPARSTRPPPPRRRTHDPNVPGDLGWGPAPSVAPVMLSPLRSGDDQVWSGTVTLPSPPQPGQQRLVVEELEQVSASATGAANRLVHIDVINL